MKIIDLLNKIANGEEVKFKIIDEQEDYYCKKDDFLRDSNNQEVDWWLDSLWLNKEVEIVEEEPRDIEVCGNWFTKSEYDKLAHSEEEKKIPEKLDNTELYLTENQQHIIVDKLNEIIDYLKENNGRD